MSTNAQTANDARDNKQTTQPRTTANDPQAYRNAYSGAYLLADLCPPETPLAQKLVYVSEWLLAVGVGMVAGGEVAEGCQVLAQARALAQGTTKGNTAGHTAAHTAPPGRSVDDVAGALADARRDAHNAARRAARRGQAEPDPAPPDDPELRNPRRAERKRTLDELLPPRGVGG